MLGHEWRLLLRDRAAVLVWLMWCAALLYAAGTGWQVTERTRADAAAFEQAALARLEAQRARVAEAERSGVVADRFAGFPSTLRAPAVLPVLPQAVLSIGEMDLQPHTATVSLFTPAGAAAKGQELQSPVSLAIGRFDLGYVVVVLLPLVLLAMGHAHLAEDRERRRLPLLAVQGPVQRLLWRRLALRGVVVALPMLLVSAAALALQGGQALSASAVLAWVFWVATALAWGAFWLALCSLIGRRAAHTRTAAASLVACWLLLVLLLPAALNALAQTLAPPPSPLLAATALRQAEVQADRDRERILGRYISDHPEMTVSTAQDDVAWTRNYYAQMQFVERQLQPVRAQAAAAVEANQRLRSALTWVSPAQVVEHALQAAAGTSEARYRSFAAQRAAFKQAWDAPLVAPLLAGQTLGAQGITLLPRFTFREEPGLGAPWPVAYLLTLSAALLFAASRLQRARLLASSAHPA